MLTLPCVNRRVVRRRSPVDVVCCSTTEATLVSVAGASMGFVFDQRTIKELFDIFDADGSGSIDAVKLTRALAAMDVTDTKEEMTRLVNEIDSNGSGRIEYNEFVEVIHRIQSQCDSDDEIYKAFQCFANGRDHITLADLHRTSASIPDEQPDQMLREMLAVADRDGDGVVTYQDFRAMMLQCIQMEQSGGVKEVAAPIDEVQL